MFASSLLCSSQNSLSFNCGDNGSTTVILKPVVSSPHRQLANFAPPQFRAPPAPPSLRPTVNKTNLLAPLNDENRAPQTSSSPSASSKTYYKSPLVLIPQLYPKRNDTNASQSQLVSNKAKVLNNAPTISINRRDQTPASKPLPSTLQLMNRLSKRPNDKLIVISQTTSWGSLFDWYISLSLSLPRSRLLFSRF
jgi:hypothetical protein